MKKLQDIRFRPSVRFVSPTNTWYDDIFLRAVLSYYYKSSDLWRPLKEPIFCKSMYAQGPLPTSSRLWSCPTGVVYSYAVRVWGLPTLDWSVLCRCWRATFNASRDFVWWSKGTKRTRRFLFFSRKAIANIGFQFTAHPPPPTCLEGSLSMPSKTAGWNFYTRCARVSLDLIF